MRKKLEAKPALPIVYARGGQTTARGSHTARHDFLCGPRKPQKNNFTLSSLSVVVIYKKSHHIQSMSKIKITFFEKKKNILDID